MPELTEYERAIVKALGEALRCRFERRCETDPPLDTDDRVACVAADARCLTRTMMYPLIGMNDDL